MLLNGRLAPNVDLEPVPYSKDRPENPPVFFYYSCFFFIDLLLLPVFGCCCSLQRNECWTLLIISSHKELGRPGSWPISSQSMLQYCFESQAVGDDATHSLLSVSVLLFLSFPPLHSSHCLQRCRNILAPCHASGKFLWRLK